MSRVPPAVARPVPLGQRQHLIYRRPAVGRLGDPLVQQRLHPPVVKSLGVAAKRPVANPGSLRLPPASVSLASNSRRLPRIASAVPPAAAPSVAWPPPKRGEHETGQFTCYKTGQIMCSQHEDQVCIGQELTTGNSMKMIFMTNSDDRQHRSLLWRIAHRMMLERGLVPDFPLTAMTGRREIP
jgi:hypothetical protein